MNRRNFCQAAAATAGTLVFGARAAADAQADAWLSAFEASTASQPWTLGYVGLQSDVAPMPLRMTGRMPRALQGAFYRNGPARHTLGGQRYHHLFDGDGMLQKYSITADGMSHMGRFVRTEKFLADSAAGHPVRAAFGTNPPGAEAITAPDAINVANTSVVRHGGELLALWEGGSATRMDPQTLETRDLKVWSPEYAGMPFSAHPRIEPDGTLWNFGVTSSQGLLSIYKVAPGGQLQQAETLKIADMSMVHDFAVTARHLVFLLPPLVFDRDRSAAGQTFLDSHVWKPQLGMRVLVLDKDDLQRQQWFDLPTGFVFHIGNAWEQAGTIRLDYIRSETAWNATTGIKQLMQGNGKTKEHSGAAVVEIDLKARRARQTLLPHMAEFPRVDPRVVGRRYRQVFAAARLNLGDRPGFDGITRIDVDTGKADHYRYGPDMMVEEHVFVPRPGSSAEGDGWLVGTALDLRQRQMVFSVFNAQRLADGPVAQGRLDRVMPLGLHGTFVPA